MIAEEQERLRRRSIRLPGYDYRSPGAYFVTVCTHGAEPLFDQLELRRIVERTWRSLPQRFPSVSLDSFVVMPNHIHFIVWLNPVGAPLAGAHHARVKAGAGASPAPTLGDIVGAFKSIVANGWLTWLKRNAPHHSGRVWQRNCYDGVVRDEDELGRIREYILRNPLKWEFDRENPHRVLNQAHQRRWKWLEGAS